jgi:hypothetical protein
VTEELTEKEPQDEDTDVGVIGGGGPAATIDDGDDDMLDEHGENLRGGERGED